MRASRLKDYIAEGFRDGVVNPQTKRHHWPLRYRVVSATDFWLITWYAEDETVIRVQLRRSSLFPLNNWQKDDRAVS